MREDNFSPCTELDTYTRVRHYMETSIKILYQDEQGHVYEPDVDAVLFNTEQKPYALSPDHRVQKSRVAIYLSVEGHIRRCESCTGIELPCRRYLQCLSRSPLPEQIIIGQSSYKHRILPRHTAVFAICIDFRRTGMWTPTLEVLSQALSLVLGRSIEDCLTYMSNSYLLLCRGILAINVYPYEQF